MASPIAPIGVPALAQVSTPASTRVGGSEGGQAVDFGKALANAITSAGNAERIADDSAAKFADGDPAIGIHEVVIAAEKASVSLRYAVTLKNKLVDAYRELMNTSV